MTQYVEKVLDFTPTRIFWWLLSLLISLLIQLLLAVIADNALFHFLLDDQDNIRRYGAIEATMFAATVSQWPIFFVAKIIVLRGILFWRAKKNRIRIALFFAVSLSILSSVFFHFFLRRHWLEFDYLSVITSFLIAIPFAMVDILTYVFFMEKIFTQRAEV